MSMESSISLHILYQLLQVLQLQLVQMVLDINKDVQIQEIISVMGTSTKSGMQHLTVGAKTDAATGGHSSAHGTGSGGFEDDVKSVVSSVISDGSIGSGFSEICQRIESI